MQDRLNDLQNALSFPYGRNQEIFMLISAFVLWVVTVLVLAIFLPAFMTPRGCGVTRVKLIGLGFSVVCAWELGNGMHTPAVALVGAPGVGKSD